MQGFHVVGDPAKGRQRNVGGEFGARILHESEIEQCLIVNRDRGCRETSEKGGGW
jgi:hypothetical protein